MFVTMIQMLCIFVELHSMIINRELQGVSVFHMLGLGLGTK